MGKVGKKMSETVIVGSMEIWRQNAKEIERGAKDDVNELIREEIERIEEMRAETETGVEAEIEDGIDDDGDEIGHHREDDVEHEDFGAEEE
jgi:hypothetical protein